MTSPPVRIIRSFAALDLLVTAPLAIPGVANALVALLFRIDGSLGGGTAMAPVLPAFAWFFIHLAGILGVIWALARIWMPDARLARIDGVGRIVVAGLLGWFIAEGDMPRVFLLFVATEMAGSAAQLLPRR